MISDRQPVRWCAWDADGAAAVILTSLERAADLVPRPVEILASAAASDTLAIHERPDLLDLRAVRASVSKALQQANVQLRDINLFELHDAFTILSALTLESGGFC